jgi:hypothetical protein
MFNKSAGFLATLALYCGMTLTASAAVGAPTALSGSSVLTQPGVYSILNKEQIKEHKKNRAFANQDFAHTVSSDPNFPYHANPIYSFIGLEHFFSPAFSLGAVLTYAHERDKFTRNVTGVVSSDSLNDVTGFLPYINYLVNRSWLVTGQMGGYIESYKYSERLQDGSSYMSHDQVFTPNAEFYVTWIGPDSPFTASVRSGVYYQNQRFRSLIGSQGDFYATRHFESAAIGTSVRLKYYPEDKIWNVFVHMEVDHRFFSGSRPGISHPDNANRNMLYQVGPGMHFKLSEAWELRVLALHTVGFDYGKEERIGIRLRYAF